MVKSVASMMLVLSLLLVGLACGGSPEPVQQSEKSAQAEQKPVQKERAAPKSEASSEKDMVTVPLPLGMPYGGGSEIPTMDPHKSQDVNSSQYLNEIYSGLVGLEQGTLKTVPDIAESWEVSEDGLTYTFYII